MLGVLGQLLPLMLALALSSVPVLVTVTILLAPSAGRTALAFLIGWLLGLFLLTGGLALIVQSIPPWRTGRNQPAIGFVEIVLGLGLVGFAVLLIFRRRGASARTELPRWARSVGSMRPLASFGLALALNLRPKSLLLATAAALILGTNGLGISEIVLVLLVFVVVSGSSVAVPIILALADPAAMEPKLHSMEDWILRNSRTVAFTVSLIIGVVLIGDGLTKL
jgi:Sap, sulfolipid-1-addressing protein